MKTITSMLPLLCLVMLGCQETKSFAVESGSEKEPKPIYLTANYPNLNVYMSKPGVRDGKIGISFPITKSKAWNRLSLGIGDRYYDTRIEFIKKLPSGDKYRITIYDPVSVKEVGKRDKGVVFDEMVVLTDKRKDLVEIEGVQFYTEG